MGANIDDQILDYAQYLVDEYGQTEDEALENATVTGNSIIAQAHPHFGGRNHSAKQELTEWQNRANALMLEFGISGAPE